MINLDTHKSTLSKMQLIELYYDNSFINSSHNALSVFYINLDNLDIINSSLGYAYGDFIITEVANRLKRLKNKGTQVFHLFSDEFIIIKTLAGDGNIMNYCDLIQNLISKPIKVNDDNVYINASIGISQSPEHGNEIGKLMRKAKIALSNCKQSGKNCSCIFDKVKDFDIDYNLKESYVILDNLENAIKENEFKVLFQPIVGVNDNKIIGAETLLRWDSEKLGVVSPGLFIPIAEGSNRIIPIGEWVLSNVFKQYSMWCEQGYEKLRLSINLSAYQLCDINFINTIESLKAMYSFNPCNIELEITESAIIKNLKNAAQILTSLHELGFKISIDDFGTGYSSLNYITNLAIDHIKIDRSYINEILSSSKKRLIVKAIIDVAHKMGIEVTAEGVEDTSQLQMLKKFKCDRYQGFLFSKPLTYSEFERLIVIG